jgi:site-specific DNA-methyltransferase (adenine-specific)
MQRPIATNRLLFGDNLNWLRDPKLFPDASVDLVYLDPPFNSNADYNVLFREAFLKCP